MNDIDHSKNFVLCSGDVATDGNTYMSREFISEFLLYSYRG
jgi:hypothetical protein